MYMRGSNPTDPFQKPQLGEAFGKNLRDWTVHRYAARELDGSEEEASADVPVQDLILLPPLLAGSTNNAADEMQDGETHGEGENHIVRPNEKENDASDTTTTIAADENNSKREHDDEDSTTETDSETNEEDDDDDDDDDDTHPAATTTTSSTTTTTTTTTPLVTTTTSGEPVIPIPKDPPQNDSHKPHTHQHHDINTGPRHKDAAPQPTVGAQTCNDRFWTCLYTDHRQALLFGGIGVMLVVIILRRCCGCFARQKRDMDRGQYRAVAARYTDDAFGDDMSDDGDLEDEYDSWAVDSNGDCVIEMNHLGNDKGIHLDEVNG